MTILQLKYLVEVAGAPSMREAARKLYVSQPALSTSIRELEEEVGFRIFDRNNRGITLTPKGLEFLSYAKKAINQYEVLENRYLKQDEERRVFSVSMQHYVFAVHAFMETIRTRMDSSYAYAVNETKTNKVLEHVRDMVSEVGVLAYSHSTEDMIRRLLKEYQLEFHPLMKRDTYIYISKNHPLADRKELSLEDLKDYPCVTFGQESQTEHYLSEEPLSEYNFEKVIRTNDRATSVEVIVGLQGYSIGTGIMAESKAIADEIRTIKLKEEDTLTIGYIVRKGRQLSEIGEAYVEELNRYKEEL